MDGFVVGEYVVQLVMVDVWYVVMSGFFVNDFVGGMFGVDEQDFVFVSGQVFNEGQGFVEYWQGFFEVDDMDFVVCVENEFVYFWVLVMGLVVEVYIGFQYIVYVDLGYDSFLISWVRFLCILMINFCGYLGYCVDVCVGLCFGKGCSFGVGCFIL